MTDDKRHLYGNYNETMKQIPVSLSHICRKLLHISTNGHEVIYMWQEQ